MRLRQRSKKAPSETLVSLERAVEDLLAHIGFLESENEKLRRAVVSKDSSDSSGLADHEQVIHRLQQVIRSKEAAMEELQDTFRVQRDELERLKKDGKHAPDAERLQSRLIALLEKVDRLENLIFAPQENRG